MYNRLIDAPSQQERQTNPKDIPTHQIHLQLAVAVSTAMLIAQGLPWPNLEL